MKYLYLFLLLCSCSHVKRELAIVNSRRTELEVITHTTTYIERNKQTGKVKVYVIDSRHDVIIIPADSLYHYRKKKH